MHSYFLWKKENSNKIPTKTNPKCDATIIQYNNNSLIFPVTLSSQIRTPHTMTLTTYYRQQASRGPILSEEPRLVNCLTELSD